MAGRDSSFRKRSLDVVIVLMVFYPLGVYIYTQSVNRASADAVVLQNIDEGLNYCVTVKAGIEELLGGPQGEGLYRFDSLGRLQVGPYRDEFVRRLRRLVRDRGATDSLVRYTQVFAGDQPILGWGQEPTESVGPEVMAAFPLNHEVLRKEIRSKMSRSGQLGVCQVDLPLELGEGRDGRLLVGLISPSVAVESSDISDRLSMRALRLSLVGTSLLALVAAYIVYLNDRTRQLQIKLEEEKHLAYVGTIAAGMAHEIRNPLNSVKMNIQMIEDRLSEFGERTSDYLVTKVARIRRETAARLEESVNNFLAFARPKALQREWTDLNEAVDHVVEFLEPACVNDGIRVVRDYSPGLPGAYIDAEQLGQAVENLVRNAHQAIGKDGIIEIYTGRVGDHLEVRVSDNGPGIPADAHDKIFEIFFTTKEGGSGLGLTIVKRIAESHGGSVSFDTIEKRGTTFTIKLPLGEKV